MYQTTWPVAYPPFNACCIVILSMSRGSIKEIKARFSICKCCIQRLNKRVLSKAREATSKQSNVTCTMPPVLHLYYLFLTKWLAVTTQLSSCLFFFPSLTYLCWITVQTFPSACSVVQLKEPEDSHLPEFWEIWALKEAWAPKAALCEL